MIVVGNELFDDFIRDDGYYVDKTELLYELVAKNRNKVTLFTRPRRFGKTLTMSMMENFFNVRRTGSKIFDDFNIVKNHPEFCKEWMHQYPVLFLSLKDAAGMTFENAYTMFQNVISDLCIQYSFLETASAVDPADAAVFHRLKFQEECKSKKEEEKRLAEVKNSLRIIMRMLYAVYGKPTILLIDEYDVPLAKAEESGDQEYYRQMLDLIRGIMSISLKTNEFLKFAVITGCLRISKESIFTGVNNFACYSVTSRKFSQYFGFTQEEITEMLRTFGLEDKLELLKKWYDGYIFGSTEVFCPWDVSSYLSAVLDGEEEEPQNFWANTSSNSISGLQK